MSYMPLPISGRACVGRDNVSIAFHSFRVLQDIPAQPSAYILYCILPLQYPQKLDPLCLTFGGQVNLFTQTTLFILSFSIKYTMYFLEDRIVC